MVTEPQHENVAFVFKGRFVRVTCRCCEGGEKWFRSDRGIMIRLQIKWMGITLRNTVGFAHVVN